MQSKSGSQDTVETISKQLEYVTKGHIAMQKIFFTFYFLLRSSLVPGAHKHHKVAQRSIKLTWITGSNCCQMPLCTFYHLTIVLITEAIVCLQNK